MATYIEATKLRMLNINCCNMHETWNDYAVYHYSINVKVNSMQGTCKVQGKQGTRFHRSLAHWL